MACHEALLPGDGQERPRLTVQEIFRAHGEAYRKQHRLSERQFKALWDIITCRTSERGGRLNLCPNCSYYNVTFNSCRNRHCPTCQAMRREMWIEQRLERLLPTYYFHNVFTVPDPLVGDLARRNPELFFNLLLTAGSQTLLELGRDEKRLGAQLGLTAILHTWARDMRFHAHVHFIVTGGGLTDGGSWRASRRDFLFPVRVMSQLFRGKMVAALDQAYQKGELCLDGVRGFGGDTPNDVAWRRLKRKLYRSKWVTYAKRPFADAEILFRYLGQYTHRVAISDHRLVEVTDDAITFRTRDGDTATLTPQEFIRRFLLHILPKDFVKIRHYGLLAPANVNTKLVTARRLIEELNAAASAANPIKKPTTAGSNAANQDPDLTGWQATMFRVTGVDPSRCPVCGTKYKTTLKITPHKSAAPAAFALLQLLHNAQAPPARARKQSS